jgi:hypothetical protein
VIALSKKSDKQLSQNSFPFLQNFFSFLYRRKKSEGMSMNAQIPFHLTGICICVNYDDFLSITLPENMKHFDKYIIVTSEKDTKTIQLVKDYALENKQVELLKTELFYLNGASFNKGAAIRRAQTSISRNKQIQWICIIDADIVLPPDFRDICKKQCKNIHLLYGAKRVNYDTYDDYINNKCANADDPGGGIGIGYLQIYYQTISKPKLYSTRYQTAGTCDMDFKRLWPSPKQWRDIGVNVKHLGESWRNWQGRITKSFV